MKKRLAVILCFLVFWLFGSAVLAQYIAIDPTRALPSARVLGLGKAFTALADDAGSMYTNPAGLNDAVNWEMTSMSGKFLDEYSFLSFSGFYPTEAGVLGLGYAGTSIGGAYGTTIEAGSDPNDPVYEYDLTQVMENRNAAVILSYANELKKVPFIKNMPQADRLSFGTTLKLFSTSLSGGGITGGNASGYDMDLGVKYYPPQKWMKFGVAAQNFLPVSMGGKLTYDVTGHIETYPVVLEAGAAFNILGKENALWKIGDNDLKLMLDMDMHPTLTGYPNVWHTGVEWYPISMLALRAGIDQDAGSDGSGGTAVYSDMAYGVGIKAGGFSFDYAYHTFAGAPNIDNSYFSLSYGLIPKPTIGEKVTVKSPADKLVTIESTVAVAGKVFDSAIKNLTVNSEPLKFDLRGEFNGVYNLKVGKNPIVLEGTSKEGKKLYQSKFRVLRLQSFPDVQANFWGAQPISLLAMQDLITGYPDGTFRPRGNITRAEMCAVLMKAKGDIGTATRAWYTDVSPNHWAAHYIASASQLGIVKGYADASFHPGSNVSRAEGLAMIARFAGISEEAYNDQFMDVTSKHWAAKMIAGAYRAGLLDYLKGQPFLPDKDLSRAETVEMLYRTAYVQGILNRDLLNWETY